jgi:purine-binding chemotaxis protein CheW
MSEFVTVALGDHTFGIPVEEVRDVLTPPPLTHVPLAPPEVAGALNLRGRIVIAIDLRKRLGLPPAAANTAPMCVVVESGGELYSFLVDRVGDVLRPDPMSFEQSLLALDVHWRQLASGICRLEHGLLVVLDVAKAIELGARAVAA